MWFVVNKLMGLLKSPKTKIFLLTFLVLIFFLLIYYPGIMTYDSNLQWEEVLSGNITNTHPFISTYFMYLLSFIYKSPIVVLIYQMLVASYTFTKLYFMSDVKNKIVKTIIYLFLITFPLFAIYSITVWKDILYTFYLLNAGIIIYEWSIKGYDSKFNKKYLLPLLLALVFAYRLNGMIVAVLFLLVIIVVLIRHKEKLKNIIFLPIIFILLISSFTMIKNYYVSKLPLEEDTDMQTSTLDNYMIWIMGEYLNSVELTEDEYTFLNSISSVSDWREEYSGYIINFTNNLDKDLVFFNDHKDEFRELFINLVKRDPKPFIIHYLKADSLLISPVTKGYIYTYGFSNIYNFSNFNKIIDPVIPKVHVLYDYYINFVLRTPVLKLVYAPANAFFITILIVIYVVFRTGNNKKFWIIVPMVLNTMSLLPINIAQDLRYVYINYLTFVLALVIFSASRKEWISK